MTVLVAGSVLGLMEGLGFTVLEPLVKGDLDPSTVTELREVLQFIEDNKDNVIVHDDHNGGNETRKLSAVVILASGKICESFTATPHCLNALYIDHEDNTLHLSTASTAGNIYASPAVPYMQAVEVYNSGMINWIKSKRIIAYKTF
jgi:hypothetical protein